MRDPLASLAIDSLEAAALKFKKRSAALAAVFVVTVGIIHSISVIETEEKPIGRALPRGADTMAALPPDPQHRIDHAKFRI